jgi:hypothetical protein
MQKRIRSVWAALLSVLLIACGMPSSFNIAEADDRIEITAKNASSVREGNAEIKLEKGEQLIIESGIESGGIDVTIRPKIGESSQAPVFEGTFEHPEEKVLEMEPGEYEVIYEVIDIGTYGSLTIRKSTAASSPA